MEESYSIKVNGRDLQWRQGSIFYGDIVRMVHVYQLLQPVPLYSVTYSHGPITDREGSLTPGQSVSVKDGMQFNAYVTNNA